MDWDFSSFIAWVVVLGAGVAVLALFIGVGNGWYTGEGVSTDFVMGVESSGVFWRTMDVYLRNEHPTSANVGKYCLLPAFAQEFAVLKAAAENNTVCKLYYHSTLAVWPWRCASSEAIIDRVECD